MLGSVPNVFPSGRSEFTAEGNRFGSGARPTGLSGNSFSPEGHSPGSGPNPLPPEPNRPARVQAGMAGTAGRRISRSSMG
jgi:hypothetical protein